MRTYKIRCPNCDTEVYGAKLGVRSYAVFHCDECGTLFEAKTSDKGVKTNILPPTTISSAKEIEESASK